MSESVSSNYASAAPAHASGAWLKLWEEKFRTGLVRNDPDLLVLHRTQDACGEYGWGTVFYSKAREDYKTRVGSLPEKRAATFDLELMRELQFAQAGGLNVAANPNSIVPGHLVLWPEEKRAELTLADLREVSRLAREQTAWTFIHNMERAAASIVDWAHFQAYPWEFPLTREACETLHEATGFKLSRLADAYPAYVLAVEAERDEQLAAWLFGMLGAFAKGFGTSVEGGERVPCNIVWRGAGRAWLIPRSLKQSVLAATYVGALEMGGLFCLPNADSLRQYLPDALRAEVRGASIADEPEMRAWCEQLARDGGQIVYGGQDDMKRAPLALDEVIDAARVERVRRAGALVLDVDDTLLARERKGDAGGEILAETFAGSASAALLPELLRRGFNVCLITGHGWSQLESRLIAPLVARLRESGDGDETAASCVERLRVYANRGATKIVWDGERYASEEVYGARHQLRDADRGALRELLEFLGAEFEREVSARREWFEATFPRFDFATLPARVSEREGAVLVLRPIPARMHAADGAANARAEVYARGLEWLRHKNLSERYELAESGR
ncbi:MAG TPA: hypothetical protein VGO96_06880, partial [Pyrinomonadaceae bacterium]|nr:hypothetical protein [Pyrinomonadaceae bacterium]